MVMRLLCSQLLFHGFDDSTGRQDEGRSARSAFVPQATDTVHVCPSVWCLSNQPTVITFANKSPFRVRALWIDFKGNEVSLYTRWPCLI